MTEREHRILIRSLQQKAIAGEATPRELSYLRAFMGRPFADWAQRNGVQL